MNSTVSDLQVNELGDVIAVMVDGREQRVDPDDWGWESGRVSAEERKKLSDVASLPGFAVTVTERPDRRFAPGPKPKRPKPLWKWDDGAAPAAVAISRLGAYGRFDRLSDALTWPTRMLPKYPRSSPVEVYDLVKGRLIEVAYTPPRPTPGGAGRVYVLEDGTGVKIGYTTLPVEKRVMELQVGNSRLIGVIATIAPASGDLEAHLQGEFAKWWLRGEWFDRNHLLELALAKGGWENLIRQSLPPGDWQIMLYPGYG